MCVRTKDDRLRLCVDYRELNKKTHPDHHPIPRIQETLDNLGGNTWFSVLDQGKAYHQGFLTPESQPLTTFRNLLLPCNYLPVEEPPANATSSATRRHPRRQIAETLPPPTTDDENNTDDEEIPMVTNLTPTMPLTVSRPDVVSENAIPVDSATPVMNTAPSEDESGAGYREQASPSTADLEPTATQEYTQHNGEERTIEKGIPPTSEETRPRRVRQPPNRLTYYMPGQACSGNASQVSTSIPVANWWESPERPWIPTPPYTWIPPAQSCPTAQIFPLSPFGFTGRPPTLSTQ